ncbi:MAG: hypothetical protein AMXMBFR47_37490 [Planctomycetota bacterium]
MTQFNLFDFHPERPAASADATKVRPAAVSPEIAATAARLPSNVRLGTSSWSFPGWRGIVYADATTETTLARHGLPAYAAHPLLRMVGIDRTYYAPIAAEQFAAYASVTPPEFRFLVKAPELCLIPRFHARNRQGQPTGVNPRFLDPAFAADLIVRPAVDGLGDRLGPIVFQFTPLDLRDLGGVNALLERLRTFLLNLPPGPLYAIELRNRELLTERYMELLAASGVAHCFNVHPSMPKIDAQATFLGAAAGPALVVRWMLGGSQRYEEAKDRYSPFDRIVDEDAASRDAIAELIAAAVSRRQAAYIIANNKAEGSAPRTLERLASRVVERIG